MFFSLRQITGKRHQFNFRRATRRPAPNLSIDAAPHDGDTELDHHLVTAELSLVDSHSPREIVKNNLTISKDHMEVLHDQLSADLTQAAFHFHVHGAQSDSTEWAYGDNIKSLGLQGDGDGAPIDLEEGGWKVLDNPQLLLPFINERLRTGCYSAAPEGVGEVFDLTDWDIPLDPSQFELRYVPNIYQHNTGKIEKRTRKTGFLWLGATIEEEVPVFVTMPAGLQIVRKATESSPLQMAVISLAALKDFHYRGEKIYDFLERVAGVEGHCRDFVHSVGRSQNIHAQRYYAAKHIWDLGIDLEAIDDFLRRKDRRLFTDKVGGPGNTDLPIIYGMQRHIKDRWGDGESAHPIGHCDVSHSYYAEMSPEGTRDKSYASNSDMAKSIAVACGRAAGRRGIDSYEISYEEEKTLSRKDGKLRDQLFFQRACRFTAIAAAMRSYYQTAWHLNAALTHLHDLIDALESAPFTVRANSSLARTEINWHRVNYNIRDMCRAGFELPKIEHAPAESSHSASSVMSAQQRGGQADDYDLLAYLTKLKEKIDLMRTLQTQLHGDGVTAHSGVVQAWGALGVRSKEKMKALTESLYEAHRDVSLHLNDMMHANRSVAEADSRLPITVSGIKAAKDHHLRKTARARLSGHLLRQRAQEERRLAGRGVDQGEVVDMEPRDAVPPYNVLSIIEYKPSKCAFENRDRIDTVEHINARIDDSPMGSLRRDLHNSKEMRQLSQRLMRMCAEYSDYYNESGIMKDGVTKPDRAVYALLGRAKADAIMNYVQQLNNCTSIEDFKTMVRDMKSNLRNAVYMVQFPAQTGRGVRQVQLNLMQHRHASHRYVMGGEVNASNGSCMGRGLFAPKAGKRLQEYLARAEKLYEAYEQREAARNANVIAF